MRYLVLCFFLALGCANFRVQPAESPQDGGLHFFLPKPYILVWWERATVVRGTALISTLRPHFEVLYLPDQSQRYTISQYVFLAKGDFSYQLKDGWLLTEVNGRFGTEAPWEAVSGMGKEAVRAVAAQAIRPEPPKGGKVPPPVLYELRWDPKRRSYVFEQVKLAGLEIPEGEGGK